MFGIRGTGVIIVGVTEVEAFNWEKLVEANRRSASLYSWKSSHG